LVLGTPREGGGSQLKGGGNPRHGGRNAKPAKEKKGVLWMGETAKTIGGGGRHGGKTVLPPKRELKTGGQRRKERCRGLGERKTGKGENRGQRGEIEERWGVRHRRLTGKKKVF